MKTIQQILSEVAKVDHLSKFDKRSSAKYPSEKDMPVVLIFKRKAIRTYPDHQKIGLYYSQALDKYISIPFGPGSQSAGIHINENESLPKKRGRNSEDEFEKRIAALPPQYKLAARDMRKSGTEISRTDLIKRMSPREIYKYNLPGGLSQKATDTLLSNRLSGPRKVGRIAAIATLGIGRMIRGAVQGTKKVTIKKKPINEVAWVPAGIAAGRAAIAGAALGGKALLGYGKKLLGKFAAKKNATTAASKMNKTSKLSKNTKVRPMRGKGKGGTGKSVAAGGAGGVGSRAFDDDEKGPSAKKTNAWDAAKKAGQDAAPAQGHEFSQSAKLKTNVSDAGARTTWDLNDPNQQTQRRFMDSLKNIKESSNTKGNINIIREMVNKNQKSVNLVFEEKTITLNNRVAKKVLKIYESLNSENRKKAENMLNEDIVSFRKFVNFAIKS